MSKREKTEAQVMDAAEALFMTRGLASVKLEHIAAAVNMRHASLYYYAPEGKQALYLAVMHRCLDRHRVGIEQAIARSGAGLAEQMRAVAAWFASQTPLDLTRIVHSDMSELAEADAQRLDALILESLREPIAQAISAAEKRGELRVRDAQFAAMSLIALVQSVHNIPDAFAPTVDVRIVLAQQMAEDLLFGWVKR
jgi:AcrR family transcriptional regulator